MQVFLGFVKPERLPLFMALFVHWIGNNLMRSLLTAKLYICKHGILLFVQLYGKSLRD